MLTSSCKAKGRTAQQEVCRKMLEAAPHLEPDDIRSTSMGCPGLDILISPRGRKTYDWASEVKYVESLNVVTVFWKHFEKYRTKMANALKLLIHRKNRTELLVTLRFDDFLEIYKRTLDGKVQT